jgi:hypothetical protein
MRLELRTRLVGIQTDARRVPDFGQKFVQGNQAFYVTMYMVAEKERFVIKVLVHQCEYVNLVCSTPVRYIFMKKCACHRDGTRLQYADL